jgi:iron complex outermembrane recepter protein
MKIRPAEPAWRGSALTAALAAALAAPATGQTPGDAAPAVPAARDIGTVNATGAGNSLTAPPAPGTAPDVAPSRGPLSASQPTSVVGSTFIRENITPTNNYDRIIQFTPSVQNVEPAGAGLQQNYQQTIRGFQYTQFNTIFDGIVLPGLPTNFAPQSASYFLAHDIGSVQVDRGPGTASTLGYATFGGTVSITSTTPQNTARINPYATIGSYSTKLYGLQLDSGALQQLGGARGFIDAEGVDGRGALSGTRTNRKNVFSKIEVPVGESTVITFVGLYDDNYANTPYGATAAQIAKFGPKYALNDDPRSQSYRGYNWDQYHTDFEYLGVRSTLGDGWAVDNKTYTNGYFQQGQTGLDPNGTTPNLTSTRSVQYISRGQVVTLNNDVPGFVKHNDFRDYGNILRVTKETAYGQIRTGFWIDDVIASNYRYQAVLNQGAIPYYASNARVPTIYVRNYHTELRTVQPYLEWALTPLPGLVVTPGLKYTATTRILDAQVNSGTRLPAKYDRTYDQLQPAIDARYTIRPGWVAYAQTARGFVAPPINVLYTNQPANLTPQNTWNYQVGTTYQADTFTLSADGYYIDFSNRIASRALSGGDTAFFNSGGAIYKGLEFEGTVRVGGGVSFYGNYTLNSADLKRGGGPLSVTPRTTAAAGVVLHRPDTFREGDLLYGSVIGKFIGPQYLQDSPAQYPIRAYRFADLAIGYKTPILNGRTLDFRVNVNNIANDRSLIGLASVSGGTTPLYWVNPGRSIFFSVAAYL